MGDKTPIDIEALIQWAIGRTGSLPWEIARPDELAFDRGLTANLRRRPSGNWVLAEACAGLTHRGRPLMARMSPGPDGAIVIDAIKSLPPATAAIVLRCARAGIQPDWMDVVPKLVPKRVYGKRRGKKRHRATIAMVWTVDPEAICAARRLYSMWHEGIERVADMVSGELQGFRINGFAAAAAPWEKAVEKAA